jgi:hypothetical protein
VRGLSARLPAVCKPSELIRGGRRPGAALPVAAMLPLARKARHARPGPHRTISRSGSRTETRNVPSTSAWFRDEACPRGSGIEVERPYDRRTEAWRRASGIAPCRQRRRRRTKGKTPGLVQTVPLTPTPLISSQTNTACLVSCDTEWTGTRTLGRRRGSGGADPVLPRDRRGGARVPQGG